MQQNLRFGPQMTQGVKNLLTVNIIVFLITRIINFVLYQSSSVMQDHLTVIFSLTPQFVLEGYIWQIFTYQFFHGGWIHLFFNMFTLWMIGPELEEKWSTKFFIKYYFICGIGAGVFIFTLPLILDQNLLIPTVGASGAVFGLLLAYAVYWPDRKVLIWFIFPVPVKYLVLVMGLISLFLTFQTTGGGGISHVGHLGGLITGYLYLMYKLRNLAHGIPNRFSRSPNPLKQIYAKYKDAKKRKEWEVKQEEIFDEINRDEKVDTLLEKISKRGWKSLSEKERSFLKKASEQMKQ